jgi:hypothetical protein
MERDVGGTWRTAHRPRAGEVSAKGVSERICGSRFRAASVRPTPGSVKRAAIPASGRQHRSPTIVAVTLDIQPLTAKRIPDLATLFDQGGDPKWCWSKSHAGKMPEMRSWVKQ